MKQLSVIIPARNEEWLKNTVDDVLAHSDPALTDVIVVLDGAWPLIPLDKDDRVTVLHHPASRGQRACTNEGARISTARYIMKLDAHCSVAPGFDAALLAGADLHRDRPTLWVPAQKNLHVFDWACGDPNAGTGCGWTSYMGPLIEKCPKCGGPVVRLVRWVPRRGTTATSWRFDADLHFQYWKEHQLTQQGDYPETLSLLGAGWMIDRADYWTIFGGLDEAHGSWGQMGTELSCKAWLSGGRVLVNKRTWFAHMFRTRGGFGFPWPITAGEQEKTRIYSRKLWRSNGWKGQVHPLSWLVDRFNPPDWSAADRAALPPLSLPVARADAADPHGARVGEVAHGLVQVPTRAVGLGPIEGGYRVAPSQVLELRGQAEMGGVTAAPIVADDMVENRDADAVAEGKALDQPREHESMDSHGIREQAKSELAVAVLVGAPCPIPAAAFPVNMDTAEQPAKGGSVEMGNRKVGLVSHASALHADVRLGAVPSSHGIAPSLPHQIESYMAKKSPAPAPKAKARVLTPRRADGGVLYYSDCRGDQRILEGCRKHLRSVTDMPIVAVTLAPTEDWGAEQRIVLTAERGPLTMFKQILMGLRILDTEMVYFAEHDVLYHPSHFLLKVGREAAYHYNTNVWKVDAVDGKALHYDCEQTSGLIARRDLLLAHYEARVNHVTVNGFSRKLGFEPGKPIRRHGIDDVPRVQWQSEHPNIDIRHGSNLTPSRWRKDQFRDQRYTKGWIEGDGVPGWGTTKGRFTEFFDAVVGTPTI